MSKRSVGKPTEVWGYSALAFGVTGVYHRWAFASGGGEIVLRRAKRRPDPWRAALVAGAIVVLAAGAVPAKGAPPDGREYEMISPPQKNGGNVMPSPRKVRIAPDGSSVAFASLTAFADPQGTGLETDYVATRANGAWSTHAIMPVTESQRGTTLLINRTPYYQEFTEDLEQGIVLAISPIGPAPDVEGVNSLYLRTDVLDPGPGTWSLLNIAGGIQIAPASELPRAVAATPDFSHILFESKLNLVPEVPPCPLPTNFTLCTTKLYEWHEGEVRLAGVLPNGEPARCPALSDHPCAGAGLGGVTWVTRGAISTDGEKVFFSSPVNNTGFATPGEAPRLYMREGGTTTVEVSASERTDCAGDPTCGGDDIADPAPDPNGPAPVRYAGATPDGGRVFFTSAEALTDTVGSGLYVYDTTKPDTAPDNLSLLSVDQEPADGDGAPVHGVMGFSDDGDTVYYVAEGQLVAGAPTDGVLGLRRMFVWNEGETRYVGALYPPGEGADNDALDNIGDSVVGLVKKTGRVTPSGRHLLFTARHGEELGGYDHGQQCGASIIPCSEVYVYDLEGDGGAGKLMCASCMRNGASATTNASHQISIGVGNPLATRYENRAITADGRRVFFTSGEALISADDNGQMDAYLFDTETGEQHLLSTGQDPSDSVFLDATPSGDDVLFATRERLVGIDVDQGYDLYTARVGGGLASQHPAPPVAECADVATCQGAVGDLGEAFADLGTVEFAGGDAGVDDLVGELNRLAPVLRVHPLTARQQRQLAARGRTRLSVTVSEPGRIAIRARARIGGRARLVGAVTVTAQRGGTAAPQLVLSRAARQRLARAGTLRLSITVRYSKVLGAQRAELTLVRAKRGRR